MCRLAFPSLVSSAVVLAAAADEEAAAAEDAEGAAEAGTDLRQA